jgi:hypothetical protein
MSTLDPTLVPRDPHAFGRDQTPARKGKPENKPIPCCQCGDSFWDERGWDEGTVPAFSAHEKDCNAEYARRFRRPSA